jgi:hypothetical protein
MKATLFRVTWVLLVVLVLLVGGAGGKESIFGVQDWRTLPMGAKVTYVIGFTGGLGIGQGMIMLNPAKMGEIDSCTAEWTYGQYVAVIDKYVQDNPDKWDKPLGSFVFSAIANACAKR